MLLKKITILINHQRISTGTVQRLKLMKPSGVFLNLKEERTIGEDLENKLILYLTPLTTTNEPSPYPSFTGLISNSSPGWLNVCLKLKSLK